MTTNQTTRTNKLMSYLLRHNPQDAGLELDPAGWVDVEDLITGLATKGRTINRNDLDHIVATNTKKRFEYSQDGQRIRASQGHSIDIDLNYESAKPPEQLYHGTATIFLNLIQAEGLKRQQRHHVHLSSETKAAMQVGSRHGKPVLLTIRSGDMHRDGHEFFVSTNGVWLTEHVPSDYIVVG